MCQREGAYNRRSSAELSRIHSAVCDNGMVDPAVDINADDGSTVDGIVLSSVTFGTH